MEAYRAHASAVYMTLTAADPLYQAFLYAHAADKLGYLDPIFKVSADVLYTDLCVCVKKYPL